MGFVETHKYNTNIGNRQIIGDFLCIGQNPKYNPAQYLVQSDNRSNTAGFPRARDRGAGNHFIWTQMVEEMSERELSDVELSTEEELDGLRKKNRAAFARRLLIVGMALATAAAIEWRRELAITAIGRWHEIRSGAPATGVSGAIRLIFDDNAVVVDVRSADEFAVSHLPGASSLNWDQLRESGWPANWPKTRPVLVYCTQSDRSGPAAAFLRERGIEATSLTGGILALTMHDVQLVDDRGQTWKVRLRASDHPWLLPKKYSAIRSDIGQTN